MVEEIVKKALRPFDIKKAMPSLKLLNSGALEDVLNTNGCAYYQWIPNLVEDIKPHQIVELGGAMGVWDLMVLQTLPPTSKLYSITLEEHGLEFCFIDGNYPNFVPIVGDDLDLTNWPKDLDLGKTDLWFFDSKHEAEHLRKELALYSPFFKKGAILLFDDIHSFGLESVWNDLPYEKYDATDPLHYSGYGVAIV